MMNLKTVLFLNEYGNLFVPYVILMIPYLNVVGINIQANKSGAMHFDQLLNKLVNDRLYGRRRQKSTMLYYITKVALQRH
jgi:hypothetical protein